MRKCPEIVVRFVQTIVQKLHFLQWDPCDQYFQADRSDNEAPLTNKMQKNTKLAYRRRDLRCHSAHVYSQRKTK
jgi:hypothetical protein